MESAVFTSEGCWAKGFQSAVDDSLKLVCLGAFKMSGLGPFSKTHVSDLKRKRGVRTNGWVNLHLCVNVNTLAVDSLKKKGCSETSDMIFYFNYLRKLYKFTHP